MTVVNPKSISGINSITTGSGSDDILTIHTNNGTERLRVDSTGATKIVTGIVTTLTATTGIVTTLTANTVTSLGAVSGTTGTFSGAVSGTTGTFTGDLTIPDKIVHTGDTDTSIRLGVDTVTVETGGSERIRVDSAGRLGIGQNSPTALLHLKSNAPYITFEDDDNNQDWQIQATAWLAIRDQTNSAERLRIDSSGRLLLGTTTEGHSSADNFTVAESGDCGITIRSGTTNLGSIFFSDATSGGGEYAGFIQYDHNAQKLYIGTGDTGNTDVTIDSSGRVLIGTATEGEANANNLTIAASGQSGITLRSGSSNDGAIFFSDATSGSGEYAGFVQYNHTNDKLNFGTATAARAFIDSSGNFNISNGNLVIGTSGKGIDFSATSDASGGTSELLDDYEEGSWTPDFQNRTSAAPNVQEGRYRKIGNQVFAYLHLNFNVTLTSSDTNLTLIGLPFTSSSGHSVYGATTSIHMNNSFNLSLDEAFLNGVVPPNLNKVNIYFNSAASTLQVAVNRFGTGNFLTCVVYFTD